MLRMIFKFSNENRRTSACQKHQPYPNLSLQLYVLRVNDDATSVRAVSLYVSGACTACSTCTMCDRLTHVSGLSPVDRYIRCMHECS